MQVKLDQAYTYKGKTYGPGDGVEMPDNILEDEALTPAFRAAIEAGGGAQSSEPDPLEESIVQLLADNGYDTLESVRAASDEDLLAIKGIGDGKLAEIREKIG